MDGVGVGVGVNGVGVGEGVYGVGVGDGVNGVVEGGVGDDESGEGVYVVGDGVYVVGDGDEDGWELSLPFKTKNKIIDIISAIIMHIIVISIAGCICIN